MKLKLPSITALVFALAAISLPAQAEMRLTPFRALKTSQRQHLRPALDASFHFRMEPGVDCTGTFVSNTGHFITALHCVAGCLAKNHAIIKEPAIEEPVAQTLVKTQTETLTKNVYAYKMTVDEDRIDEGISCPGYIGNKKVEMNIVMTGGKGWLAPKEVLAPFSKKFPEDYKSLLDDGYEHQADFAIVQAVESKPTSCLSLNQTGPGVGQDVHAISYACLYRDEIMTKGHAPLYTKGKRTRGFKESQYFNRLGPAKMPFDPALVDRKETFFSTLDIEKCGSGTAVLDGQFNIVGVATRVYKSGTRYEHGSLEAIDVSQVWRDLMHKKSGSDIKAITSCEAKKRTHQ